VAKKSLEELKKMKTRGMKRMPLDKPCNLHAFVSIANHTFAQTVGRQNFKSVSNYVDHLIEEDRKKFNARIMP
jgi:hypothetical protein